jgi:hypothetical protein
MDELDTAINNYLTSLHSSKWGRGFDLVGEDSRANAIAFIRSTIEGVNREASGMLPLS